METTAVIFRMDREGNAFALMPELPADNYGTYCTCYQHVGQHCAADYFACTATSRPATPAEYADLEAELTQRGYDLEVRQRATYAMHDRRRRSATDVLEAKGTLA
jgi:hypothetical protein